MVILGKDVENGAVIELTSQARRQGVYLIGTTGTGKTTLLKSIAYQDMTSGDGLCVLDPHGDMIDDLLALVPADRVNDVIVFAPGDEDQSVRPLGLNLLACDRSDPRQVRRVSSTVIDTLRKLFFYSWGPRMEDLLRNSILTLMEKPGTTLLDLWLLLASTKHRVQYTLELHDPYLKQFWWGQFAGYTKKERVEVTGSSLNKIARFLADTHLRRIIAQPTNAFDIRDIMDTRKILLVNLSKGDLGEDNAALLGSVLVNLILIAALTRRSIPPQERVPFHLIVDEYQSFATESFPTLQSEARKYAIDVLVAHQYRDQLDDSNRGSTLNVGNFITMRTSGIDSDELARQFDNTPPQPEWRFEPARVPYQDAEDKYRRVNYDVLVPDKQRLYSDMAAERANQIAGLANWHAQCRLIEGHRLKEYDIVVAPLPEGDVRPDVARSQRIRGASLKLGTPAAAIDALISDRIGEGPGFDEIEPVVEEIVE
ncbi:MAG: type IV secretory system conjugative DNA transfer family protein [Anaerolineae bacterium]|nr:type IV secretory system conjugative DNA transfer family protein [Anaerolineae bacterium]